MKKIIVIMLISMLLLTTTTTVFGATNLTELNEEFPNYEVLVSNNQDTPYYILYTIGDLKAVIFFSEKVMVNFDEYTEPSTGIPSKLNLYYDKNVLVKSYALVDGEYKYIWSQTYYSNEYIYITDGGLVWDNNSFQYCNFDIKDKDGRIFFFKARYPLTTIKGQISSKTITTTTLMEIKTLIVFLMGFLISVVAFRKAWVMLRTILSGA